MSGLRSTIDELRGEELSAVSDESLADDIRDLYQGIQALEAERLRRVAELDRRGSWAPDGHISAVAWLVDELRMEGGVAAHDVRAARALEGMPGTREALSSGQVSTTAAGILARARSEHPAAFARQEETLVERARTLAGRDLRRAMAAWGMEQDAERASAHAAGLRAARSLRTWIGPAGMIGVEGRLHPENGETVLTALRVITDAWIRSGAEEDDRTPTQRRADALGEVCRRFLDRPDRPSVGGERPHIVVTIPWASLTGAGSDPPQLDHTGPVHRELLEYLSCDASIVRLVLGPGSEPLDVGRKTSVVPASIRRALIVRDRSCRFPGCDRPPAWCQPHHIRPWVQGGRTGMSNLMLLCPLHHHLVHPPGSFRVELVQGRPRFFRPDGTVLAERRRRSE